MAAPPVGGTGHVHPEHVLAASVVGVTLRKSCWNVTLAPLIECVVVPSPPDVAHALLMTMNMIVSYALASKPEMPVRAGTSSAFVMAQLPSAFFSLTPRGAA